MGRKVDLQKIKYLRKLKRITLQEMADQLGYQSSMGYSCIERGRNRFSAESLAQVAQILEVASIDELFTPEYTSPK